MKRPQPGTQLRQKEKPARRSRRGTGLRVLALAVAALAGMAGHGEAAAQPRPTVQIWFAPKQSFVQRQPSGPAIIDFNAYDFPRMLSADKSWQRAAANIAVLSINSHTIERYTDLPAVVAMTQRHPFLISTQGGLVFTGGVCMQGKHVEGVDSKSFDYAGEVVKTVRRWNAAGGRLDYLIMDSPFFFGYYHIHNDCNFSIAEVARRAAATFLEIRKIYPSIRIMDAEGPGPVVMSDFLRDFDEWLSDFRAAAGQPIDSVALDLHWTDDWHTGYEWVDAARRGIQLLHARGVRAGLIVNAKDKLVSTTEEWMEQNRAVMRQAHDAGLRLDFIQIASWSKNPAFPSHNMPENDPTAYASLVDYAADLFR